MVAYNICIEKIKSSTLTRLYSNHIVQVKIYCFIQSEDKYSHVYTTAKRLIFKILSCMRDYFQDISSLLCMRF